MIDEAHLSEPFIRKLEVCGPLSSEDKRLIYAVIAGALDVPARQDLIQEGQAPEGVVLILKGFAARYKMRKKGTRQIIAYLLPGDFCDLDVAFLSHMDHSIGTLSACYVVRIAPERVRELLQRPAIARALRVAMLLEAANAREWLFSMGQRAANERTAHLLCELLSRLEVVGLAGGNSYGLPINQQDLADTLGVTVVHMNRSLGELSKAGFVSIRHKRVTILDLPGLKKFGEFEPNYLHLNDLTGSPICLEH